MIKRLSFLLLSIFGLGRLHAATITADVRLLLGNSANNAQVRIWGYDLPQRYNGRLYLANTNYAQLTNGLLNVTIPAPGRYDISFPNSGTTVRVAVPPSDDTYDISELLTNVVVWVQRGISTEITAGSGIIITTNNAGLPNETLVISSTGGGGTATNAYTLQISGAGLSLSADALNYIYTLSLNANLQAWSALDPTAKQDHSANLDAWSGITPSSKQNALGFTPEQQSANLDLWSALAPSSKQTHSAALDFWSGVAIDNTTLQNNAGVLSAVTGGSGNVTGDSVSTDNEIPLFSGTGGKTIKRSSHFLSDYQLSLGFTPPTSQSVTDAINSLTIPIDNLRPLSGVNIAGVNSATNFTPIHLGAGLSYDASTSNLNVTVVGGTASALGSTNCFLSTTNAFVFDCLSNDLATLGVLTNTTLVISNAWNLTNTPSHAFQINYHQDTNGWPLKAILVDRGLVVSNNANNFDATKNSQTRFIGRLDWSRTNVELEISTNWIAQYAFTNSNLTPSGGGGGGGGTWTYLTGISSAGTVNTDNTTGPIDTTGASLIYVSVYYAGGSTPTCNDSKVNGTPTTALNTYHGGFPANNPKHIAFAYINPANVGTGHTFTIPAISGAVIDVQVLVFAHSGGTPTIQTVTDNEVNSGNWGSSSGVKPGSITPANSTSLHISSVMFDVASPGIANSAGFTMPISSVSPGTQIGYKIKSDALAEDPNWTTTGGNADAFADQIVLQ